MTCKDTINSDETQRKSDEEKRYLVSEVTRYNKIFESDLLCCIDSVRDRSINFMNLCFNLNVTKLFMFNF